MNDDGDPLGSDDTDAASLDDDFLLAEQDDATTPRRRRLGRKNRARQAAAPSVGPEGEGDADVLADGAIPPPEPVSDDDLLLTEADDDIVARAHGGQVGVRWLKPLVIVALIVGIIVGVYVAGKPTDAGQSAPGGEPTAMPTVDETQRKAELQATLAKDPNNTDAHLELGVILFNENDLDGAHTQWDAVTKLDPTSVEAWYDLGFYYLSIEPADNAAAQAAWQKVVELDPTSELAQTASAHMGALGGATPGASASGSASAKPASATPSPARTKAG